MKPLSLIIYATGVFLLVVALTGAYFRQPRGADVIDYPWLPSAFLNRTTTPTQWNDLSSFELEVNCIINKTSSAPMIEYEKTIITEQRLRTIARSVFGMDAPERLEDYPLGGIVLRQGLESIRENSGGIWYYGDSHRGLAKLEDWNQTDVRRVAEYVIADLDPYWEYPTDAVMKSTFIGPTGWSSTTNLAGRVVEEGITEFSVRYGWFVRGVEVTRAGCSVCVAYNGDVLTAIYRKPAVRIVAEQQVTVTPEEALATFVAGWSINEILGAPRLKCPTPRNGTVIINDIRLVYYPLESPEGETIEALVYRIEYDILFEFEGMATSITSYEYEYAN